MKNRYKKARKVLENNAKSILLIKGLGQIEVLQDMNNIREQSVNRLIHVEVITTRYIKKYEKDVEFYSHTELINIDYIISVNDK